VITEDRREQYRQASIKSALRKKEAQKSPHKLDLSSRKPGLDPLALMPKKRKNGLRTLSLFSGGGGLDLGFDRAGFSHVASYDIIDICGETLSGNRPNWQVYAGPELGDVRKVKWTDYLNQVDVIHGGPPCQPFSTAGQQLGKDDERNMWGPFVSIVNTILPLAFVAENVPGLLDSKFKTYVERNILGPLKKYTIKSFVLNSAGFGVPQQRKRVFFVGFLDPEAAKRFYVPAYSHRFDHLIPSKRGGDPYTKELVFSPKELKPTMGIRQALGLDSIGIDGLCPTIRSAFTGKRNTTSILNSTAAAKNLAELGIWGNGVSATREDALKFPPENGHHRLSVQEVALLQGFPDSWTFHGAVYKILGQIGNSVCPPVAYNVALAVSKALKVKT
jgi:DNA (cytosine-5)-methyltransferase 1